MTARKTEEKIVGDHNRVLSLILEDDDMSV
jgi:hypothetical protein